MIAKSVEPVFGDSSWMGFGFGSLDLDWIIIGLLHAVTVAAQKGLRE